MSKHLIATAISIFLFIGFPIPAVAKPEPDPTIPPIAAADPTPSVGAVVSPTPSLLHTPEGWNLSVSGRDETQVAINPLTTAITSREYLVAGTFTGTITGKGMTQLAGGVLETGYQLGCGILADKVKLAGSVGMNTSGTLLTTMTGAAFPIAGTIEVSLRPGEVKDFPIIKKEFKGPDVRVSLHDIHIKIDGCAGQSFLRSYAILTSKNDVTDDIVAYYGTTNVV